MPLFVAHVRGDFVAEQLCERKRRPQPDGVVITAGRDELPVGAERYTAHRVCVPGEWGLDGLAGAGVPPPHGAVGAAGGDELPVGAKPRSTD